MRKLTLVVLAAAATMALSYSFTSRDAGAGKRERFTALFNGKNLEGWDYYLVKPDVKMKDVWSVQDGILVCKGEPLGYLHTKQKYTTDFVLVVEWRWAPGTKPGNSGVLLRVNGEPTGVPRSQEAQLRSGNAGDLYGFHGMKIDGDPARRSTGTSGVVGELVRVERMKSVENEPGEWNRYVIIAEDGRLTATVNGQIVNSAFDCDLVAGPIALQSEGGEIHFRRVDLTSFGE